MGGATERKLICRKINAVVMAIPKVVGSCRKLGMTGRQKAFRSNEGRHRHRKKHAQEAAGADSAARVHGHAGSERQNSPADGKHRVRCNSLPRLQNPPALPQFPRNILRVCNPVVRVARSVTAVSAGTDNRWGAVSPGGSRLPVRNGGSDHSDDAASIRRLQLRSRLRKPQTLRALTFSQCSRFAVPDGNHPRPPGYHRLHPPSEPERWIPPPVGIQCREPVRNYFRQEINSDKP